jgi:hypothetical protein
MEQRDYLLRQAEQLGQVLGKILLKLLNLKGKDTTTIECVNQIFTEELDFDVNQLIGIDEEKWINTLKIEKQFDVGNLERLADILLFVAENADSDKRNQLYKKSLIIYHYLEESENTYSFDRNFKIEKIKTSVHVNDISHD